MISAESLQAFYRAPDAASGATPTGSGARFVILCCMDPRLRPEQSLGLSVGDAYVLRNAGGRVSPDTIRSLLVALSQQGAHEIVVIHHTDCAMSRHTNQDLRAAVSGSVGTDASGVDFLTFSDLAGSVRDDVNTLRASPQIPKTVTVVGFTCDTDSGTVQLVVGSPTSQLPQAQLGAPTDAPAAFTPAVSGAPTGTLLPSLPGMGLTTTALAAPPPPAPTPEPVPWAAPPNPPNWADPVPAVAASGWETPPSVTPTTGHSPFNHDRRRFRAGPWIGTILVIVGIIAAIGALSGHHHSSSSSSSATTPPSHSTPTGPPSTAAPTVPTAPAAGTAPVESLLTTTPVYQQLLGVPAPDFEAFNSDGANGKYANGGYEVTTDPGSSEIVYPDTITKVTGQPSAPTVDVEVIASSTTNPDAYYGVACRLANDGNNGYFLEITDHGLAAIGDSNGEFVSTSSPNIVIVQNGPNDIRGVCSGAAGQPVHLTLFVNGIQVLQTTRSSGVLSPDGTVGINVDTPQNGSGSGSGSATVKFNNFAVRVPAPTTPGS